MDQTYYDAVTKMEQMGVNEDYVMGWQSGYLQLPQREEQRITEAYEAGFADGEEKNLDNLSDWV
jgi:hypothetical protein